MNAAVLGFIVVALLVGVLIGWLAGSRSAAGARQTVDSLRLQLDEVVKERDANRDAVTRLAALEASQLEREKAFENRIKELIEAKESLSAQFAEISNKLLAEAQETFLKRADQRFRQSEENAGHNLKALLQPVHDRLERYETTVQKVEAERRDAFGMLTGQIEAMRTGTERVSAEAAKLV
ncbi:MAG: DNA recombination protein RmuC, partial [Sphingomicrobium sp.]